MLNKLSDIASKLNDNTFGQMTGPQILWTIIALLALYQLVAIKWRLIDRARHDGVPVSFLGGLRSRFWLWVDWRRNRRIMRAGFGSRMKPGTVVRTDLGGTGFDNTQPAGFTARQQGRIDLDHFSDAELVRDISLQDLHRLNGLRSNMQGRFRPFSDRDRNDS